MANARGTFANISKLDPDKFEPGTELPTGEGHLVKVTEADGEVGPGDECSCNLRAGGSKTVTLGDLVAINVFGEPYFRVKGDGPGFKVRASLPED